jgi:hypothetical protein
VILLVPSAAILITIVLHAAACRLPLPFGSVIRFLIIGSACGFAAIILMLTEYGLTADVVGATLVFAFAAELYLFLFTMTLGSVSANTLALLTPGPASPADINNLWRPRYGRASHRASGDDRAGTRTRRRDLAHAKRPCDRPTVRRASRRLQS